MYFKCNIPKKQQRRKTEKVPERKLSLLPCWKEKQSEILISPHPLDSVTFRPRLCAAQLRSRFFKPKTKLLLGLVLILVFTIIFILIIIL